MISIIVSMFIIILSFLVAVQFLSPHPTADRKSKFRSLKPKPQTGDLLFLSGASFSEKAIKTWIGCPFSHVAMVVRDDDGTKYLMEADVGQGYREGPRMIPLSEKLHRWKGNRVGFIRRLVNDGQRPSKESLLAILHPLLSVPMDMSMLTWATADLFPHRIGEGMFCSELVALLMQGTGLLGTDKPPWWYSPSFLLDALADSYDSGYYFSF